MVWTLPGLTPMNVGEWYSMPSSLTKGRSRIEALRRLWRGILRSSVTCKFKGEKMWKGVASGEHGGILRNR